MSKAFTKEDSTTDDALPDEELPLPPGARNYMTPAGQRRLQGELAALQAQKPAEAERAPVERRIRGLVRRLDLAEVVDPAAQPAGKVLFGATVTVRDDSDATRCYRIVGIDEVDPRHGWVSWLSPIARALLGHAEGDLVVLRTPGGDAEVEIETIEYITPTEDETP